MPSEKGKKGVKKKDIIIWCQHHRFPKHQKKLLILLLVAFDSVSHQGGLEDGEEEKQSQQHWSCFPVVIFCLWLLHDPLESRAANQCHFLCLFIYFLNKAHPALCNIL